MTASLKITNGKSLGRRLTALGKRTASKLLKKSVRASGRDLVKDYRAGAPVKTGLLRESIGQVVKQEGTRAVARVGVRRGFKSRVRDKLEGAAKEKNPIAYAEQAERKHGFARAAFDKHRNQAVDTMGKELGPAIEAEAQKLS